MRVKIRRMTQILDNKTIFGGFQIPVKLSEIAPEQSTQNPTYTWLFMLLKTQKFTASVTVLLLRDTETDL